MAENKVALITAGGSGMGAEAARRLAADGFRVAIMSSSGKGEALAKELGGVGVTGSNQEPETHQALVDKAMAEWGRIDVLVNSAGDGPKGGVLDISDEDWHRGMEAYLLNVIRPCRLVVPIMAQGGGGAIINISTFAAYEPDPRFPTSGAFRAALGNFTKLLADKHGPDNIRVNNILPGFIDSRPHDADRLAPVPLGRAGTVAEVSGLVSYLAGPDGGYVTGQNLRIDGGLSRGV
ncbi:SDR family oxidoreductase [Psychromarinibacter sp. C21-152]|uniref:SDR family oxidoreductase n=1 Tax=Psychromarinibacter sediminicola TaxID=3033385 RepID=A0AAE3NXS1_9RHOB|nr:SDR family oxidoreductase [Psychromarinibacter sediminicola]MDF0603584.1 SDR family oxidoreductase [Psychromarinibacter sediminicola]